MKSNWLFFFVRDMGNLVKKKTKIQIMYRGGGGFFFSKKRSFWEFCFLDGGGGGGGWLRDCRGLGVSGASEASLLWTCRVALCIVLAAIFHAMRTKAGFASPPLTPLFAPICMSWQIFQHPSQCSDLIDRFTTCSTSPIQINRGKIVAKVR